MTNDSHRKAAAPGEQKPDSRQSAEQGRAKAGTGKPGSSEKSRAGIGSSQAQDRGSPDERERRPSGGTPDVERGSGGDIERGAGSRESLVQDPTGAFKERP
jgi:hypothetical protein